MPDYLFMLDSRLSAEQRSGIERLRAAAQAEQINIYLAGSAVRDLITGAQLREFDFLVEGNPARLVHALEKAGGELVDDDEKTRVHEILMPGEVEFSVSAAREEVYERPGTKPDIRWSTAIEDLRTRDFAINAIAISLNPNSLGLLLDPANGLADLEKREVRAISMHTFTNQPVRMLRLLRLAARMGFAIERRTQEWFNLAVERKMHDRITQDEAGRELRQACRDESIVQVLKDWGKHELLEYVHPKLRRTPPADRILKLFKVRDAMLSLGLRPSLFVPVVCYVLARLSPRELASALERMEFPKRERERITSLDDRARAAIKMLQGRKTGTPREAFAYLETVPLDLLAYIQNEYKQAKALGKIKNYFHKWRPLRQTLPYAELEALGIPRGPQFDKIIENFFQLQLAGRARQPQDRIPALRRLAGLKPEKPKPPEPEKGKEVKKGKAEAGKPAASPARPGAKPGAAVKGADAKVAPAAAGKPGYASAAGKPPAGKAAAGKPAATPAPAAKSKPPAQTAHKPAPAKKKKKR